MHFPSHPTATSTLDRVATGLSRSEMKSLERRQNSEVARGLVASTKVQAAALTAAVGLQCVGMLSREAQFQASGDPVIANRVNHIVDQFACFVGNEVARFGM